MTTNDIDTTIADWTTWASNSQNKRFDIALFKIWIQFEKFISELFVLYATGGTSEKGFKPKLKLQFRSEEQLNAFLKEGNKKYIDFPTQIQKLSKHIFENYPFDIAIFSEANNCNSYNEIVAIRNYIAHESGESKTKYLKSCFGNNEANFKEPNDFLQSNKKQSNITYYTYYVNSIKAMCSILISPHE